MICSLLDSGSKPSLEIPDSESYRIFALVDWKTLKSSRLLNGKELPFPTDLAFLKLLILFWKALSPKDKCQAVQIRIFGAFVHLFLLLQYIVGLLPVIFWGLRNNWYQSYNCTIIEIGAQRSQSCPIAWPNQSTYLGRPESASIEIIPFRPHFIKSEKMFFMQ